MHSTVIFVLLAIVVGTSRAMPPSGRILGGEDAVSGQFTFAASVRVDHTHICGGSIIGKQQILTAAHCVVDDNNKVVSSDKVSVRVGSINQFAGGKIVSVSAITVHPSYEYILNDVAVLTLQSELEVSDKLSIIELASSAAQQPAVGTNVTVAGWGEQSSGATPYKLQSTTFTVASDAVCTNGYANHDETTFCLAHSLKQGSCTGDAGNGAVYNDVLVGISSFVVGACGSRYPDVFVNVTHFASWIESQF
ncbi:trypsin alpha [Anastrepha ludens]|uniref:trypsin alpha n=1 Tax=Anastrepha ludens TaxID=28586 RepID=UPI0023AFB971|nr:trypsin alpha [Anastrepha ludens]